MDLTRQQLRRLALLERDLERMARKLTATNYSDRSSARWSLKLADLRDRLALLAQVDEGVQPLLDRAQLLQAGLVTLIAERGSVGARAGLGGRSVATVDAAAARLDALERSLMQRVGGTDSATLNEWMRQLADVERSLHGLPLNNVVLARLRDRCWAFADRVEAMADVSRVTEETFALGMGDLQFCA